MVKNQLINRDLRARFQPAANDLAIIDQFGADQRIVLRGFVVGQPVQIEARPQIRLYLLAAAQAVRHALCSASSVSSSDCSAAKR